MIYTFEKYQSSGNDFIVIKSSESIAVDQIWKMCDRRFGIGADGLILIHKNNSGGFNLKFYNSDGSTDTLCGNGSLCAIDFAIRNLDVKTNTFEASDGEHRYIPSASDSLHQIMFHNCQPPIKKIVKLPDNYCNNATNLVVSGFYIDTGSPHFVVFVDDVDKIDILSVGKYLRHDSEINKEGCNVDFVEIIKGNTLKVRTYERGVEGETLSCGTGSVASAICLYKYYQDNDLSLVKDGHREISLFSKGGKHIVSYDYTGVEFTCISLKGRPQMSFCGEIEL